MRRRRFALAVLALTIALLAIGLFTWVKAGSPSRPDASRPDASRPDAGPTRSDRPRVKRVVLVTIDSLRADVLACYGHDTMGTHTLSGVARDAVLFEQAVAPTPWTRPSVASLLTGLPPKAHGTTEHDIDIEAILPAAVPTLAELLRGAGYETAGIGYNAFLAYSPNAKRGFKQYAFFPDKVSDSDGKFFPVENNVGSLTIHGATVGEMQSAVDEIGSTPILTQLANQWITDHAGDEFFLWLHYFDPHAPYTPPVDYFNGRVAPVVVAEEEYGPWALKLWKMMDRFLSLGRTIERGTAAEEDRKEHAELHKVLLSQRPALQKLYEAEVEFVDQALGQVVQTLVRLGLYDDTLLIVTSDHGEEFWDHGMLEHGHSLKQELLRVPLLVKPPGHRGAVRVRECVSIESVMPTILDLCSIPRPTGPGYSPTLAPTWERPGAGGAAPPRFAGGILYGEPKGAVFFGTMKYVREYETGAEQLYDLSRDPYEQRSLVADAPPALEEGRRLLQLRDRAMLELRKSIWRGGVKTTAPNEAQRKALRSHGYIK